MKTKILDCTLRDGGYYTNWDFDSNIIDNYIKYTNDLKIDYIEIGYRNKKKLNEYRGQFFYTPLHTLKYFKKKSKHKIAIMIDYKSIKTNEINDLLSDAVQYVDLVRVAVAPSEIKKIQDFVKEIKSMGFKVALNIMYLSQWKIKGIKQTLAKIQNVDFLYLVDSYGSIFPENLERVIYELKGLNNLKLGFHSHDNIELAFANTLTAIKNKIDIVDSTILGMGRGSGNLKTELLLIKIYSNSNDKYKLYDALDNLVSTFSPLKEKYKWGSDISYKFAGINSYPQKDIMYLKLSKNYKFSQIIAHFDENKKTKQKLEEISVKKSKNKLDTIIIGGGRSIIDHKIAIEKILENHEKYNIIFSSSKFSGMAKAIYANCYQIVIGSDISNLKSIKKNVNYIFPLDTVKSKNKNFYSLKINNKNNNEVNHLLSSLILTSKITKSKNVLIAGFDGFDQNDDFFNVFKANELIFKSFERKLNIQSITDTKYSVSVDSIYSKI